MIVAIAAVTVVLGLVPAQLPPLPPILPPPPDLPLPPPPPPECLQPPLPPLCPPPLPAPPGDLPPTFSDPLEGKRDGGYVVLRWRSARDDHGVAGYRFYRDGNYVARRGPDVTRARLRLPCGRHRYRCEAVDGVGQTDQVSVRVRREC